MFFNPSVLVSSFLVTLAAASPMRRQTSDCNTGSIQCCNSVQNSTSESLAELSGLLGITLPDLGALIGLDCSPLSILGIGSGSTCSAQPVCCSDNSFGGLISLGCDPLDLGL